MTSRARTTATWTGAVLVAALLPLIGPAAPASAAACTSEAPPTFAGIPTGPGCDDTGPPDTTIGAVEPQPNDAGWLRTNEVTFTFSGSYADTDTGPISFQCQFVSPGQAPPAWSSCTSPATYAGLAQTPNGAYTFRVRAIDTDDNNIDLTTGLYAASTDTPDLDQTPAEQSVRVDTDRPNAYLFGGPPQLEGSGSPITPGRSTTYTIGANEPDVTFRCLLDAKPVACGLGKVRLTRLAGGDRVFSVKATDPAGNEDLRAATAQFTVPYNVRSGKGWKRVHRKGYFAGDVLQTRKRGARISFRAPTMQGLRLIAPAGPGLGKLRIRVGKGFWHTVNLRAAKAQKSKTYVVRDATSPLYRGRIQIECLSKGKPVRVDALVFPPG